VTYDRFKAASKRRSIRLAALAYKGNFCVVCDYDGRFCPSAMDFHHVDYTEKDFNISSKTSSLEALKPELDKTVLLCSRCHRETHDGLHPQYLESEEPVYDRYEDEEDA
jgi:hypothetical protein